MLFAKRCRLSTAQRLRLLVVLLSYAVLAPLAAASAADVRVYCPAALRAPMLEAARAFAHSTSHRIEFIFASLGAVHKRMAMGERADIVIGSAQGIEALSKLGVVVADSSVGIAQSALGLVARSGASLPKADDTEGIVRLLSTAAMLGVPDVGRGAPGASQANELLQALKVPDDVQARIRRLNGGADAVKQLTSGDIDVAVVWMSEVAGAPGIEVSGPILSVTTHGMHYAAAVPRSSLQPTLARAFIAHLRRLEVEQILRRAGYLPVD